ncbi:MAG: right-handed parallel beta-helix repeat-containing protein [Phycisphaerae bacterium]|jgi:hypothetical protein
MLKVLNVRILAVVVGCALILPAAWSEELHVPGMYATIQAAIDAAQPGDEVVIAPGTYTGPGNKDLDFGGKAITVRSTAPEDPEVAAGTVIDCEGSGRGFYFHSSEGPDSIVAGLTITNGYVTGDGGGVYCYYPCSPTLSHCTITQNAAADCGGGIGCMLSSPILTNCEIVGNTAAAGGGLYCAGNACSPTLTNCIISRNMAAEGGAIYCYYHSSPTLTNCAVAQNMGSHGVFCLYGALTLTNCTIAGNMGGSGVYCRYSSLTLDNCIVWGNSRAAISFIGSTGPIVTYSAIEGGWEGEGNIVADPTITPDGHLTVDSPCRNASDPNDDYSGQTDIDGEPRVLDGQADMGADEWLDSDADGLPDSWERRYFQDPLTADPLGDADGDGRTNVEEYIGGTNPLVGPRSLHVDPAGNDTWDGLTEAWDGVHGPKATVQAGIDSCDRYEGDTVIVAPGLYTGVGNRGLDFGGKSIMVRSIDSGDPAIVAATVVDGGGEDRVFQFRCGEGPASVVAGLTITGGYAEMGGGVFFHDSDPTMINCVVTHNTADDGGGICCYGSNPTLDGCTISHNAAVGVDFYAVGGGGIYCYNDSRPTLNKCTIVQNTAARHGAGMCCEMSDPTLSSCTFVQNGAWYCGGGLYCDGSTPTLTNCTIAWNVAGHAGGAWLEGESQPLLTNCIVWGNTRESIAVTGYSGATVTYSNVEGGWEGVGNIDADPLLTPDGHLQAGSPCHDAGDPEGDHTDETDIDGEPRVLGGRADMGADEWLDSDADGLPDWWEVRYFDGQLAGDPLGDEDADGRANLAEYSVGSDPLVGPRQFFADVTGNDNWNGLAPAWDGVSGPKATIQAAIDACHLTEGDEVIVAEGTYTGPGNRDLEYAGRQITVRSVDPDDPAVVAGTIVDCESEGRGFSFWRRESAEAVVAGLTIMHGYTEDDGGGVYCTNGSSPTLVNCGIKQNTAHGDGGGLFCRQASELTLTNCTITENTAINSGGGVRCYSGSSLMLTDCTISWNRAEYTGGMSVYDSSAVLVGCTITHNATTGDCGGLGCGGEGTLSLVGCRITHNAAEQKAGGVSGSNVSVSLINCTVANNAASGDGGGVYSRGGAMSLRNCTISGNTTGGSNGGGLYCYDGDLTLRNCVVWGNSQEALYATAASTVVATFSAVEGGWTGEGNVDADALLTRDGHLRAGSPCRDAGDPDGDHGDEADIDGEPRVVGGRVDMGADEWLDSDGDGLPDWWEENWFGDPLAADPSGNEDGDGRNDLEEYARGTDPLLAPRRFHVATSGNDGWDGLAPQWDGEHGPKATIQAGIDDCHPCEGDEVVVAEGTYTGIGNRDIELRGKAITVRSTAPEDPEVVAGTVIDCEGSGRGFYFHSGEGPDSIVAGLTITNGSVLTDGAAVYCTSSDLTLTRCTFAYNAAASEGGAVYFGGSRASLDHCVIMGNVARHGGGIHFCGGGVALAGCVITGNSTREQGRGGGLACDESSPVLSDCTVESNTATEFGGGVFCTYDSNPTFIRCEFIQNAAGQTGGAFFCRSNSSPTCVACMIARNVADYGAGLYCSSESTPALTDCRIINNTAEDGPGGGVYWCENCNPILTNCVIAHNTATTGGGGVYCSRWIDLSMDNCTISDNVAPQGAALSCSSSSSVYRSTITVANSILWSGDAPIWNDDGSTINVTHSDVAGGWEGEGNIDEDPLFIDPENGDFHLAAGSPCIDAGDPGFVPGEGETDIDGQYRVWDGDGDGVAIVDMGADEARSPGPGDLNCDGLVNNFDIRAFILAVTDSDLYAEQYPGCDMMLGDLTGDGLVNNFDIRPFIRLLAGD